MHIKKFQNMKLVVIISVFTISLMMIGVTYAVLSHRTPTAENNFEGKGINIGVIENDGKIVYEDVNNIVAFSKISKNEAVLKKVQIKNINSEAYPTTDTLIRVRLVPMLRYNDGTKYEGQVVPTAITKNVVYDINTKDWVVKQENGETYYYYGKTLAPDKLTEPLFTKVTYRDDIPKDAHFELQVLTEGIRSDQVESEKESPWAFNILSD